MLCRFHNLSLWRIPSFYSHHFHLFLGYQKYTAEEPMMCLLADSATLFISYLLIVYLILFHFA